MPAPHVQFRPMPPLEAGLTARRNGGEALGAVAERDLNRYYVALQAALEALRLSYEEACLVVDALNGTLTIAETALLTAYGIIDAIEFDGLDRKWGVDRAELTRRIQAHPFIGFALADGAERFWQLVGRGDPRERRALLQAAGLLVVRPELPVVEEYTNE